MSDFKYPGSETGVSRLRAGRDGGRAIEAEVIIAGGGPVGMLLASELALLGVDTVVVEPNAAPVEQPRAGTLHSRTAELLVRRGFVPADPSADPRRWAARPFPFAGAPGLTMRAPSTEGPPVLSVPQVELERRFEVRAAAVGARILRGCRVSAVGQDAAEAFVEVEGAGRRRERLAARFVVGADGARSVVRARGGFADEVRPATMAALIAKVRVAEPTFAPAGWNRTPRGWTRIDLDPHDVSRVMTFDFEAPHPDRGRPVTLGELEATFARIAGAPVVMTDPQFMARFSDFGRLATAYRRGRLLLAGDAAHVHFPIGGQGLNLGIHDALNLGWKLAAAVRGGGEALLDSYEAERRPAARRVLDNTAEQAELMRAVPEQPGSLLAGLLDLDDVGVRLGDVIGGRDQRHPRAGVTAGEFQANVRLHCDRGATSIAQLLYAARPLLIALDDDETAVEAAAPWADRIAIVRARAAFPVAWRCALIRPDGYLAWSANEAAPALLAQTLTEWFGPAALASGDAERIKSDI